MAPGHIRDVRWDAVTSKQVRRLSGVLVPSGQRAALARPGGPPGAARASSSATVLLLTRQPSSCRSSVLHGEPYGVFAA